MPMTDEFKRIPLDKIIIDRDQRQRRAPDPKTIIESVRKRGVLHPIIVQPLDSGQSGQFKLIAGERRYLASKEIGLLDIPCRLTNELSPVESQIIELEENIKRADLEWDEGALAIQRIHFLYMEMDSNWTMGETAEQLGMTLGNVSLNLRVAGELNNPKLAKASGLREAYNILGRRDQRAMGEALQELIETVHEEAEPPAELIIVNEPGTMARAVFDALKPIERPAKPVGLPSVEETLIQASFLEWAPQYQGKKFNLIHCDFPYGVNVFNGPQAGGDRATGTYSDTKDEYVALLECLCVNLDRVMAVSGHLMFWYSDKHRQLTMETFARLAPSLEFCPFPLIWTKSDNAGIASDTRHHPRHVYETCLFATRGSRQIVRLVSDAHPAPTDKRWHPSTKPEPMLRHFMEMLVDENTRLLDPTCGGGSAIRAAESLGAAGVLGLESDPEHLANARSALKSFRLLRNASKEL